MAKWKGQSHQGPVKITEYRDKYNAQDWADSKRFSGKPVKTEIAKSSSIPSRGDNDAPYPFGDDGSGADK